MIQSSQPISLKLTWSRRRWQRGLFLGGGTVLLSWPERALISLKAFSLLVLPVRANPRVLRSRERPPLCSRASSSKQSCWENWSCWRSSRVLVWRRTAKRGSDTSFLRMRSSAPRSPSRSKETGPRSSARGGRQRTKQNTASGKRVLVFVSSPDRPLFLPRGVLWVFGSICGEVQFLSQ
uniref:Uncharacterized protein n=1 Tax=Cyprinodon variegatus TaxID=28743 RepID=A0A3Q2DAN4_CYPVA